MGSALVDKHHLPVEHVVFVLLTWNLIWHREIAQSPPSLGLLLWDALKEVRNQDGA